MTKLELIDTLLGARDALSDLVIELQPRNADERAQFDALVQRRDRLVGTMNLLLESAFDQAASGLGDAVADIEKQVAALEAIDQSADNLRTAVQATDKLVTSLTALLKLVAT